MDSALASGNSDASSTPGEADVNVTRFRRPSRLGLAEKKPPCEVKGLWIGRRLLMHFGLAQHQPDSIRLFTDIAGLRAWVQARKETDRQLSLATCLDYLELALVAAHRGNVASGYELLHIADREAVFLMNAEERKVRAQSLRAEARSSEKFGNSWRSKAILSLIAESRTCAFCGPEASGRDADVPAEALAEAVAHQNTLHRNDRRKTDKTRWQLASLGCIVMALVLAAFFVALALPSGFGLESATLLPHGIYLGLLGGFVSSAISQRTADRKGRVPELELSFYAALARGALGAATSIPVYMLVKAGLIAVGSAEASSTWGLLFLCFLSGFSERWFLSAVTSVSRDEKKGSEAK